MHVGHTPQHAGETSIHRDRNGSRPSSLSRSITWRIRPSGNATDAALLVSSAFQRRAAQAFAEAMVDYLR